MPTTHRPQQPPAPPTASGPGAASRPASGTGATPRRKVRIGHLADMKRDGRPIVMITAYDFPFARLADAAGADILLVGDSLGMVVLGFDSTLPVTMGHMLHHVAAVARARPKALVVGDLPFMSYQLGPEQALRNAGRLVQQAGAEAVKLEGGARMVPMVEAIRRADIPVMGHLGLTPQSIHQLSGYRVQGRDAAAARRLEEDALRLQDAGCFAVVLEAVPVSVAASITAALEIPTIGIGAGRHCDGQVLVLHDVLGIDDRFQPRFVRRYADLAGTTREALGAFVDDVRAGRFPDAEHSYED